MTEPLLRTVEVVPPSRRREGANVALAGGIILAVSLYAILLRVDVRAPGTQQKSDLPFQTSFQDLPGPEQRMFRALSEGFGEARRMRAESGRWPAPEVLAREQIPPFAPDAIDKAGYRWTLEQEGLVVNYRGTPAQPGNPLLLLLIQEPEAVGAEQFNPAVQDSEHVLLPDGKLLHVTYWKRAPADAPAGLQYRPEVDGWTQVRLAGRETPP